MKFNASTQNLRCIVMQKRAGINFSISIPHSTKNWPRIDVKFQKLGFGRIYASHQCLASFQFVFWCLPFLCLEFQPVTKANKLYLHSSCNLTFTGFGVEGIEKNKSNLQVLSLGTDPRKFFGQRKQILSRYRTGKFDVRSIITESNPKKIRSKGSTSLNSQHSLLVTGGFLRICLINHCYSERTGTRTHAARCQ